VVEVEWEVERVLGICLEVKEASREYVDIQDDEAEGFAENLNFNYD